MDGGDKVAVELHPPMKARIRQVSRGQTPDMTDTLPKSSLPPNFRQGALLRSLVFSLDFFLIITALYQLKPATRSLLIEALGADSLPYVWIGSAFALLITIAVYRKMLIRFGRVQVVLASCLFFAGALVVFRLLAATHAAWVAVAFYIFVDIFGVVLAEQFWSLADGTYRSEEGRHWYGFVGTGGLIGGIVGGLLAAFLIRYTPLQTPDLMLVAAALVGLILGLTWAMNRWGLLQRTRRDRVPSGSGDECGRLAPDRRQPLSGADRGRAAAGPDDFAAGGVPVSAHRRSDLPGARGPHRCAFAVFQRDGRSIGCGEPGADTADPQLHGGALGAAGTAPGAGRLRRGIHAPSDPDPGRHHEDLRPRPVLLHQPCRQGAAVHSGRTDGDVSGQGLDRHVRLPPVQGAGRADHHRTQPMVACG